LLARAYGTGVGFTSKMSDLIKFEYCATYTLQHIYIKSSITSDTILMVLEFSFFGNKTIYFRLQDANREFDFLPSGNRTFIL